MEFNELIQARRSLRAFDAEKTVTKEQIEEIVKAAQMAPTWKNSQTGRYYVVGADELETFRNETLPAFNVKSSSGASLIVTTYVKNIAGHTEGQPDNELGNQWGAYDLGIQNAYMVLAASNIGLDTLIMGIRDAELIREKLAIPSEEEVVAVIAVGYKAKEPKCPPRKPLEEILTFK